ncbi:MAG: hypothetical protein ACOVQI_12625, partial [Tagaea sp.]
ATSRVVSLCRASFRILPIRAWLAANADTNAARSILRRGLAVIGDETTGGGLPLAACGDLAIQRSTKHEPSGASLKKVAA